MTLTFYKELLDSTGLVLCRADIVNENLVSVPEVCVWACACV